MSVFTYRMGATAQAPACNSARNQTTFLVISDTHALPFDAAATAFGIPCPKVDVVLHCGDLTQAGGIGEYKGSLSMLSSIDAELKLVIAGNHDVSLDRSWCQEPEDEDDCTQATELMTGSIAAAVTYLTEGTYTFTLANGTQFSIYASPYTPEFGDYAFMYKQSEDRFNSKEHVAADTTSIAKHPIPNDVDIVMTHGPPYMHHDLCRTGNAGCKMLMRALERVQPRMHCFGHIHEGAGTSTIHWPNDKTLLVNAAVMGGEDDLHDTPSNMPIIVKLDLTQKTAALPSIDVAL